MRNKSIKLIITFLVLLFLISIFSYSPTATSKTEVFQTNIKEDTLKSSKFWNLTGSLILIDDSIWNKNWAYTAWHYDWCSGSGSWTDPYVIENVTINGQYLSSCIDIRNSDKYFIIRNCTLYNSRNFPCIYFLYTNNGKIIDNNCSDNNGDGIYLRDSNNNTLSGNTLINNRGDGINLVFSNTNTLSGNTFDNNRYGGIYLSMSDNIKLLDNIAINNSGGIILHNSNSSMLLGNTANNNSAGISLGNSFNNTLSGNSVSYNNYYGIYVSNSDNNTLSGNFASNNDDHGINLYNSDNNTLSGNIASNNNDYGIYLDHCNNHTLLGNTASNNDDYGIYLGSSNNNTLLGNTANNNYDGIYLYSSDNNTLSGNIASNNNQNGIYLEFSDNSTLSGNTANNNYVGVYLMWCDNSTLSGNTAYNNYKGINIFDSNNIKLSDNIANNNTDRGIGILWCNDNIISRNTANNNIYDGILLFHSDNCILSGNTVNNNWYGIDLRTSINNTISGNLIRDNKHYGTYVAGQNLFFNNSFLNNSVHAFDDGINNHWNNSVIGNYWDNYNGEDSNNDGIGDTPYNISGSANSQDNYPIWWDFIDISINTPNPNEAFGTIAPNFTISIDKGLTHTMWYTIDIGLTNITFTGSTDIVDQTEWDKILSGFVTLTFYANNTLGVISSSQVVIGKDVANPIIIINSPKLNDSIGVLAPNFNVEVIDANLDTMWYTIDGGIINTTFTTNGTINQELWNALSNGTATITFYANDSIGHEASNSVIVRVDKIIPSIIIHSPIENQLFGTKYRSPMFNISVDDIFHDKKWYTLNQDTTKYFFITAWDYINEAAWYSLPEDSVKMRFYTNDSAGNIGFAEVTIRKDISAPIISILNPQINDIIGTTAPNFDISLDELNLDNVWYSLNGGINITFTGLAGTINQALWEVFPEGNVVIKFYANDTLGRIGFAVISITKDVTAPIITINNPQNNDLIGATAPNFDVTIEEPNLDRVWYSLNGSTNIIYEFNFYGGTGTVNQVIWDALPGGNITIRFYASDLAGNSGFREVIVIKDIPQTSPLMISGYNMLFLIGIISVTVVIIIKKRVNPLTPP